ncbi:hypothetical protein D3C86_1575700 [compost metagenome]
MTMSSDEGYFRCGLCQQVTNARRYPFSFVRIRSLYPATSGQAIPPASRRYGSAETLIPLYEKFTICPALISPLGVLMESSFIASIFE